MTSVLRLPLDNSDRRELLRIARVSLREFLDSGLIPPGKPHRQSLLQAARVYVSLERDGEPRGRSGSHEVLRPIYRGVQEEAIAAGTRDTRFRSVTADEIPSLIVSIAVLGIPESTSVDAVDVTQAIAVEHADGSGFLLPSEARESCWTREQYLGALAQKALMGPASWARATLVTFPTDVFDDITHPALT